MRSIALAALLALAPVASAQVVPRNVEQKDDNGWTALMTAAQMGKVDDIKALLARGANIEARDPKVYGGETPLLIALELGQHDAAVLLLDRHASIAGDTGKSALELAARGGFDDVVDRLLAAKVPARNMNALLEAAKANHPTTIKKLVKAGARITAAEDSAFTPLIVACRAHAVEAAQALIEAGASVNEVDAEGTSALHWAIDAEKPTEVHAYRELGAPHDTFWISRTDAPLVELLVANKVKLGELDKNNNTALHQAAFEDAGAVAKVLIAAGIDTKAKNSDGLTAYDIAKARNNSVEPLLRPAGAKAPVGPREHAPEYRTKTK
ncbi:MAG TPA: ankyrin repeat domain-containing protein [Kofleriaceae bacterium]|jgi:ankyrin repeat protein